MADVVSIQPADLRNIETNLSAMHTRIDKINSNIDTVDHTVNSVNQDIKSLAAEFHEYVDKANRQHEMELAETRLGNVRHELATKFGHHEVIRRTAVGILQADDLEIIRKDTITFITEEMMVTTPGYWLAPCVVALAAWIGDQPDVAQRAVSEAAHRDDEKTSLLFALLCRRANRLQASLMWAQCYLANQDEDNLDRNCIVIIEAYASGVLGYDSEGAVAQQINVWIERLSNKSNLMANLRYQWAGAIEAKRAGINLSHYRYLSKFSPTWDALRFAMEGAHLHRIVYDYFYAILTKEIAVSDLNARLDEILTSLVTDFDEEELPLRREERYNQLVIEYMGSTAEAQRQMNNEAAALDSHKNFLQLLTDAAINPQSANASIATQKFAIALSKPWILDAYCDVVERNFQHVPEMIEINIESFNAKTRDGRNEERLIKQFEQHIEAEKELALDAVAITPGQQSFLYVGIALGIIGLFGFFIVPPIGFLMVIAALILLVSYAVRYNALPKAREQVLQQYAERMESGTRILRATLSEVVDFRREFTQRDQESAMVIDLFEQISSDQYVGRTAESGRRVHSDRA